MEVQEHKEIVDFNKGKPAQARRDTNEAAGEIADRLIDKLLYTVILAATRTAIAGSAATALIIGSNPRKELPGLTLYQTVATELR